MSRIDIDKNQKISNFKTFSEFSRESKPKKETESEMTEMPFDDDDLPANPNIPKKTGKFGSPMNTDYMMPKGQETEPDEVVEQPRRQKLPEKQDGELNESQVQFIGKVAKLPKNTKASKGYNFLENVKVSKSSIWYIMVEKQDNQLQMVKYNYKKGVDLGKFVVDLKEYYKSKFSGNTKIVKLIESIEVDGNDKYSWVKNIPLIEVEGKKMISKITEDLIRLLSR